MRVLHIWVDADVNDGKTSAFCGDKRALDGSDLGTLLDDIIFLNTKNYPKFRICKKCGRKLEKVFWKTAIYVAMD